MVDSSRRRVDRNDDRFGAMILIIIIWSLGSVLPAYVVKGQGQYLFANKITAEV